MQALIHVPKNGKYSELKLYFTVYVCVLLHRVILIIIKGKRACNSLLVQRASKNRIRSIYSYATCTLHKTLFNRNLFLDITVLFQ